MREKYGVQNAKSAATKRQPMNRLNVRGASVIRRSVGTKGAASVPVQRLATPTS